MLKLIFVIFVFLFCAFILVSSVLDQFPEIWIFIKKFWIKIVLSCILGFGAIFASVIIF